MNSRTVNRIAGGVFIACLLLLVLWSQLEMKVSSIVSLPMITASQSPTEKPSVGPTPTEIVTPSTTPSEKPSSVPSPSEETAAPAPVPVLTPLPSPALPEGCVVPTGPSKPVHLMPDGVDLALAANGRPPDSNVLAMSLVTSPDGSLSWPDPPGYDPGRFAWADSDYSGHLMDSSGLGALFVAHTYSSKDTPLGNQMLSVLHVGSLIRVVNDAGQTLCYEVTDRLTVSYEDDQALSDLIDQGGLIITVCSDYDGRVWTTRALWVARPLLK